MSRPVEREERIPGPRVTEMKLGLRFWMELEKELIGIVEVKDGASWVTLGSECRLLVIRVARLC